VNPPVNPQPLKAAAKGGRTSRAGTAAVFAYLQFALSIAVGVALVPFVLHHVGVRLYGYWLASGEVLAYATMADLGILGVVPWLIAEADGRGDRQGIRRLLSTGFCAAVVVAAIYGVLVILLWRIAPSVLHLAPADRAAIVGPLTLIAAVTAIVMPARIFGAVLVGLQDVRFYGILSTANWALDLAITVTLLSKGYGLYALAFGVAVPSALGVVVMCVRVRILAPDLMSGWPRPAWKEVARLFREGFGAWLGGWGWRLSAATDAIILASLGNPVAITMLAMTAKLGQMLTHMSWVPGDSSLVGLAQLFGEQRPERLREAVSAVFRVYLALATAGMCVVLAVNGAFVRGWVGGHLFGGGRVNAILATLIVVGTVAHGMATIASVLGRRLHVGVATLIAGVAQVGLALILSRRFGVIGVPIAALCAQACVLIPSLVPAFFDRTGLTMRRFASDVLRPWAVRSLPVIAICAFAGTALYPAPLWISIPLGALTALFYLWCVRHLVLGYPPVASMIRARLASVRLDGFLPEPAVEPPAVR
jgi:O-antigen/teichoic acid export membrane protein